VQKKCLLNECAAVRGRKRFTAVRSDRGRQLLAEKSLELFLAHQRLCNNSWAVLRQL
jgi:hypothetical protein